MKFNIKEFAPFQQLGFLVIFCTMGFSAQASCNFTTFENVTVSQDVPFSGGTQYYYLFDCDGGLVAGPITGTDFGTQPYGCYEIYAVNSCPGSAPAGVATTADINALSSDYASTSTADFTVCDKSLLGVNGGLCEGDEVIVVSIPNSYERANDMTYVLVCSVDGGAETISDTPVTVSAGTTPARARLMTPEDDDADYTGPFVPTCVVYVLNHCPTADLSLLVQGADWATVDPTGNADVAVISAAVSLENCIGLPLDLISFKADCDDGLVNLEWITMSEENVKHIILQRSQNGERFTDMEVFSAESNGLSLETTYNYTDGKPLSKGFYRLKIVDTDGSAEYSSLRQIQCLAGGLDLTEIFPNPTKKDITINFEVQNLSANVTLQLVDALGRVAYVEEIIPTIGSNSSTIDMSGFTSAVYTVILDDGNRQVTKRVVKN